MDKVCMTSNSLLYTGSCNCGKPSSFI